MSKETEWTFEKVDFLLKHPKAMSMHTANALFTTDNDELRAIGLISDFQKKSSPQYNSDLKSSRAAAQQFLEQMELSGKLFAKKIEKDFAEILQEHKNYSKIVIVNKIVTTRPDYILIKSRAASLRAQAKQSSSIILTSIALDCFACARNDGGE